MRIVHYGHACVLTETDSTRILFDPGAFSSGYESLTDLDAVLITHQHFDHVDLTTLPTLLKANPRARLIVDAGTEQSVAEAGLTVEVAHVGDTLSVGRSRVDVVGGEHAIIHPDIAAIPNCGYLVDDGGFYHPGDSFFVPPHDVDVLGLPTGAPWLKLSEAVDFLRAVHPRSAVPIHEAVLANPTMHYTMFENLKPQQSNIHILQREQPTDI